MSYEKIIKKEYGEVIRTGDFLREEERKVYSLGPNLDYSLYGGVPEGCVITIAGISGGGKTTVALYLAKQFILSGKKAFYLDIEHRLRKKGVTSIYDFPVEKLEVVYSTPERILSSEDFSEILMHIISDPGNEGGMAIVDSVDALIPADVVGEGDISGKRRAPNARIMADLIRNITPKVRVNNFTVVFISHVYDNVGGYGGPKIGGGNYQRFQSGIVMVSLGKPQPVHEKVNGKDKLVGHTVEWDIQKNELGPPPGEKVTTYIRYGYGIDDVYELVVMASDLGIIEKSGPWYNLAYKEKPIKLQGMASVVEYMKSNIDELNFLKTKYKELTCPSS